MNKPVQVYGYLRLLVMNLKKTILLKFHAQGTHMYIVIHKGLLSFSMLLYLKLAVTTFDNFIDDGNYMYKGSA